MNNLNGKKTRSGKRISFLTEKIVMSKKLKKIAILDKNNDELDRMFWERKTPEERLSAVEFLREQFYIIQGYSKIPVIKRELKIIERPE